MNSAIYKGWVKHKRHSPVQHEFQYPIFMFYLDLDELSSVFKHKWYASIESLNIVNFRRGDYFHKAASDAQSPKPVGLKDSVIMAVEKEFQSKQLPLPTITQVHMLTHLRVFNFVFNPVTFYYCYDDGDQLISILSEITNTPWGERDHYILCINHCDQMEHKSNSEYVHEFSFNKKFHVSPFNPMSMSYRWIFQKYNHQLLVHMDCKSSVSLPAIKDVPKEFEATLKMKKCDLNAELGSILLKYPFDSLKVLFRIYWQAFKLYIKKAPFYDHPKYSTKK